MPPRATINSHSDRSVPEQAASILARCTVAHLGFAIEGQPFVIPFTYHYDQASPGVLYLHGSQDSRALTHLATGAPACVEVTLADGLVYSKTALYHSVNYRSVVAFGTARLVTDTSAKARVLEQMIARYFPGRTSGTHYQPAPTSHLDTTALIEFQIEEMSAKMRVGGPKGPHDADPYAPGTAGVILLDPGELPPPPTSS